MSFEFDEFNKSPRVETNMEDIMDKVDQFSADWDNFEAPGDDSMDRSKSDASKVFNQSKKSESEKHSSRIFENSRDLLDISAIYGVNQSEASFRYQKEDNQPHPNTNIRYSKIQHLLEKAKKNNMDEFYKNLEREKNAYVEE